MKTNLREGKIIVIDDNEAMRTVMKTYLEHVGFDVDISVSPQDIVKVSEDLPTLILLDLCLPECDGGKICKTLKHREETKAIPIILMSGMPRLPEAAKDCEADDYISKPFSTEELVSKIEKHYTLSSSNENHY